MLIPVILAGGTGTRLWPLSRNAAPKQLLCLTDQRSSMLEQTVMRLEGLRSSPHLIVVCNETHRFTVQKQLHHAGISAPRILLEPEGRNTAPAIALAAMEACSLSPDAMLLVLPADHYIGNARAFQDAVRAGLPAAAADSLVVFGVPAMRPETGYGYIRADQSQSGPVRNVLEFVEKPDPSRAAAYVAHGGYLWNSGMFLFHANLYLTALHRYAPDILSVCDRAYKNALRDSEIIRPDRASFLSCRADSIDYAVMENASDVKAVLMAADWSDVGSWDALHQSSPKDGAGNSLIGDVIGIDCNDSYVRSESRLVAALGLSNHVVVETSDAVLVANLDHVQAVRNIVEVLRKTGRSESSHHTRISFSWGFKEALAENPQFGVAYLSVNPGCSIAPQADAPCRRRWTIVSGIATIASEGSSGPCQAGQSIDMEPGTQPRLTNNGTETLEIIEIQLRSSINCSCAADFDAVRGAERFATSYHGAEA
jgi:mannose-1-phosphate guanylyltransferase/mannose-6-phosphate isomerase